MFKDNGREKPADPKELASLKGKHMVCPECGEYSIMTDVEFASTTCGKCGTKLMDVHMASASKATGRR